MMIEIPRIDELDRVNEIACQIQNLHVLWRNDMFVEVDKVLSDNYFKKLIDDENIFVIRVSGEIVGYITIEIKEKMNKLMRYRKILHIDGLGIDEKYRSNGYGTKLIEYAIDIGKDNGCTDLELEVYPENKEAIRLYEKLGLRVRNISYSKEIK